MNRPLSRRALLRAASVSALGASLPASIARADEPAAPAAVPVVEKLADGATLITLPEPTATGVVWEAFFRIGPGDEGQHHGVRSLLTRCWIGETRWRLAPSVAADLARAGAVAGTGYGTDWIEAWGASGPDPYDVEKAAQTLFTEAVAAAGFTRSAVEAARAEHLRALALRRDDLVLDTLDRAQARAFGDSPYAIGPLGVDSAVEAMPWETPGRFYRRFARPERAVFVAAGRITPDEARRRVTSSLGAEAWSRPDDGAAPTPPDKLAAPVAPAALRDLRLARRAPVGVVALAFLAPGLSGGSGRTDYAALLLLDALLRGGKATRLFALRDRPENGAAPLAYEVRTLLTPGRGQSLWSVYAVGERPPEEVRDRLLAALRPLATGDAPPTDAELTRAKTWLIARHREARQRLKDRAFGVGWAEVMGIGAAFDVTFAARLDAVPADEVSRLARTVLSAPPAVVYTRPDA